MRGWPRKRERRKGSEMKRETVADVMRRQATQFRAILNESTPERPLTLSRELYDKLRPEQRRNFRRAS